MTLFLLGAAGALAVLVVALERVRTWLASMRTAVGLLVALAVLASLGVLIGQELPPETYVERYGHALGTFVVRTGLSSIFHSWYFLLLVWAIALSILLCSFGRMLRLARGGRRGLRTLGSLLAHLSIAVIFAGGLVTAVGGFRRPAARFLGAGDTIEVPEGGFSLRVEEARTEFNEEGALSDYVSIVTLLEDGREIGRRRIEVNRPLVYHGVGVYQYEMLPAADSILEAHLGVLVPPDDGERMVEVVAPFREVVDVPGTELSLKALEFYADFTYDIEQRTAELASVWHRNPAVLVQVLESGRTVGEVWAFPGSRGHEGGRDLPCRVFLFDYVPDYDRGLTRFEFTRQPGTPLIYAGFLSLSIGLCLTFWTRRS